MKEEVLELNDIEKTAQNIILELKDKTKDGATILALYGDLGVGKTTLTKEIAKQLGVIENVISPTFVIMKLYKTNDQIFKTLIHIDAYRLEKSEEIIKLGWKELLQNKDNFIIVEWPEKIQEALPQYINKIILDHKSDTTRTAKFYL